MIHWKILYKKDADRLCHYSTHNGVLDDSITTPTCSVFDCSATVSPSVYSLNDMLYTCPPLVNEIGQVLFCLCLHTCVALDNIKKKVFLLMKLHPDDQDVDRFLCLESSEDPSSKL